MHEISEHEKQTLIAISEICKNFTVGKFHELASLSYNVSYMEFERKALQEAFERFQKLRRPKEKGKAWERVTDQVFRIKVISDSAISCNSKKE
jgi:hypothetical protein